MFEPNQKSQSNGINLEKKLEKLVESVKYLLAETERKDKAILRQKPYDTININPFYQVSSSEKGDELNIEWYWRFFSAYRNHKHYTQLPIKFSFQYRSNNNNDLKEKRLLLAPSYHEKTESFNKQHEIGIFRFEKGKLTLAFFKSSFGDYFSLALQESFYDNKKIKKIVSPSPGMAIYDLIISAIYQNQALQFMTMDNEIHSVIINKSEDKIKPEEKIISVTYPYIMRTYPKQQLNLAFSQFHYPENIIKKKSTYKEHPIIRITEPNALMSLTRKDLHTKNVREFDFSTHCLKLFRKTIRMLILGKILKYQLNRIPESMVMVYRIYQSVLELLVPDGLISKSRKNVNKFTSTFFEAKKAKSSDDLFQDMKKMVNEHVDISIILH